MAALSPTTLRRLQIQGFREVDSDTLAQVSPWLRFSPALCAIVAGIGTVFASPTTLFALAIIAFLGAVLPFHPFDLIFNFGIRFLVRKPPLPHNGAPRRFACAMAAAWLTAAALLFSNGQLAAGYALGGMFVAVAALVATTDICIPSMVFGLLARRGQTR